MAPITSYGFTELCTDMWLGSKLIRQIEEDARNNRLILVSKSAQPATYAQRPTLIDQSMVRACCLIPCLYVRCHLVSRPLSIPCYPFNSRLGSSQLALI
jgi:hypothetical protein